MPTFIPVATRAEAREAARQHLKNNPNLTGGNLYELPDGSKIRVRKKEGGRLSSEAYDTKSKADTKRGNSENTYTTDAARENASQTRAQAREQSQSTLHQHVYGNRPSIGEHAQDIASGGIGDDLDSVSDPDFKDFKDTVASKIRATYGESYVVDINEVTGYIRVIPRQYYNKQQYRSQQPGFDLEPHMNLDQVITGLPFIVAQNLGMSNTKFPGAEQQSPIKTTGGRVVYRPPSLPGFMEQERTPQVTPPQSKYVPPVVMQYSHGTYTNGENGTNGDNGHSHSNGSPPKNGSNGSNGNGNGSYVDQLIDYTRANEPAHKTVQDAIVLVRAGKVIWNGAQALGAVFGAGAASP